MFIEQKSNAIYRVNLALDRVLSPFWNLSKHLLKDALLRQRDYAPYDEDFQNDIEARLNRCDVLFEKTRAEIMAKQSTPEEKNSEIAIEEEAKYDSVYSEAFQIILKSYIERIVTPDFFDRKIKYGCSLIVYSEQGECWFFAEGDAKDQFDKEVRNGLASMQIVEAFLKFLNGGIEVPNSYNPKIYGNVFPDIIDEARIAVYSPLYLKDAVAMKEGVSRKPSSYEIWFNKPCLNKLGYDEPQQGDVFDFCCGDQLIGLETGQYFIPLITNWRDYFDITDAPLIVWTDHRNNIFNIKEQDVKNKPAKLKMTEDEKSFVEAATSDEFTNILSHLCDNLYLAETTLEIKEEYQKFFQTLLKIEDLKHLVDYKLYVPKPEQDTVIGVYKIHKLAGETEYNLRHMLYTEQKDGREVYKDYNEKARNVIGVKVLKPQFASFYMMDYYEFFVEEVLKYLQRQGIIKGYLRNHHYLYRDEHNAQHECEIDALVYTGRKIAVMELKTTLHIEFLKKYPKRYAAIFKNEPYKDIYDFYLVSSYADDNIGILDIKEKDGYNVAREGLKTIPYKFEVNIPEVDKKLFCLSESSFDRLKAELQRVFIA